MRTEKSIIITQNTTNFQEQRSIKKNTIFEKNEGQREKIQDQEEKKSALRSKQLIYYGCILFCEKRPLKRPAFIVFLRVKNAIFCSHIAVFSSTYRPPF